MKEFCSYFVLKKLFNKFEITKCKFKEYDLIAS